jgi:UDP-glucose 4-epimerase
MNLNLHGAISSGPKVLITGGAGFIGSHLSEFLIQKGHIVKVLDNLSTGSISNLAALLDEPRFEFLQGDVRTKSDVVNALKDVNTIYHLAAAVGTRTVITDPITTIDTNIRGTLNLLESIPPKSRVVLTSSSEVYGKKRGQSFEEGSDSIIGPSSNLRWCYAISKLMDECLGLSFWKQRNLRVTVVRLFNTVGPRQTEKFGMVIPTFIIQAMSNDPMTIYGDGSQTRCFIHVDDTVEVLFRLAETEDSVGQVVNVGGQNLISVKDLAKMIHHMTGSRSRMKFITYEEAYGPDFEDMRHRYPDISKLKQLTGFEPKINLEEMLADTIDYFRSK